MKNFFILRWIYLFRTYILTLDIFKILLIIPLICSVLLSKAQDPTAPKITPPAPNAASLGKYGQISVGVATGVPDISIPLYEIKTQKLSLPISLSYHASGTKVDEIPSWVGLGWSLNAAGLITQSTVDLNDTENIGYLFNKPPTSYELSDHDQNDIQYLDENTSTSGTDKEPDIFFFNFNGKSGKFIFGEDNQPILIPNQNLDIKYSNSIFSIVDDNGIIYYFEERETADAGLYDNDAGSVHLTSITWHITKILSSDRTDSITFEYQEDSPTVGISHLFSERIGAYIQDQSELIGQFPISYDGYSLRRYNQHLIKRIRFNNGRIDFEVKDDREDSGSNRLTDIKLYDSLSSNLIKHIHLEHDYFRSPFEVNTDYASLVGAKNRLQLTQVYDIEPGTTKILNNYSLLYNTTPLPPINSFAQDIWGYYNGQNSNETLLKRQTDFEFEGRLWNVGEANRDPNEEFMKAGVLNKIIYPTGGYSEFEYEAHRYTSNNIVKIGGGLRIKNLKNSDGKNLISFKTFEYSTGHLLSFISSTRNTTEKKVQHGQLSGDMCDIFRTGSKSMQFTSSSTYPLESFSGSPVAYTSVTQYEGENTAKGNNGKTISYFKVVPNDLIDVTENYLSGYYSISNSWKNGLLTGEVQYGYDKGTELYYPIVEKSHLYQEVYGPSGRGLIVGLNFFMTGCHYKYSDQYYYFDYTINSGRYILTRTITKTNADGNNSSFLLDTTEYYYDDINHYYPTKIITQDSKGNKIQIVKKYPHDFIGTTVYLTMVNSNIITPVIEQIKTNISRNIEIARTKTNYTLLPNSLLPKPENIQQSFGGDLLTEQVIFDSYDEKGNLLQYTTKNGLIQSFIWGYSKSLPVAKLAGVPYNSIQDLFTNGTLSESIINNPVSDEQLRTELAKLRANFPGKEITVFTHSPLLGITSQTDQNGFTTYYEYDKSMRLQVIRDQNENITNRYKYKYQAR